MSISETKRTAETTQLPTQHSSDPDRLSEIFLRDHPQESIPSSKDLSGIKRSAKETSIQQVSKKILLSDPEAVREVFQTTTTTTTKTDGYTLIFEGHKRVLTAEEKDFLRQNSYYFKTLFNISGFKESFTQTVHYENISLESFENLLLFFKNPNQVFTPNQLYQITDLISFFEFENNLEEMCNKIDPENPTANELTTLSYLAKFNKFAFYNVTRILLDLPIENLNSYSNFILEILEIDKLSKWLGVLIHRAFKHEPFPQLFKNLEALDFSTCNFTNQDLVKCVEFFPNLKKLSLNGKKLSCLKPLEKCLNLEILNLLGCSKITSLEPLANAPLTYLNLRCCHGIKDLSPLKKANLRYLSLCAVNVDMSFVYTQVHLEHLDLSHATVKNLRLIFSSLPKLKRLDLVYTKILTSLNNKEKKIIGRKIRAHKNLKCVTIDKQTYRNIFPKSILHIYC